MALKEGSGDSFSEEVDFPGVKRYYVYYQDEEVKRIFGKYFDLINSSKTRINEKVTFLNYLFRKEVYPR